MREEDVLKLIKQVLSKYLDLKKYKVFLFGSRATGSATKRSDFDIGIIGEESIPAKTFIEIQEELDNLPIFQEIELVDFSKVPDRFKSIALRNVKEL